MNVYLRLLSAVVALACAVRADAAEPEWIKLQTPSFGVISQLDESATRRWALEFDQFIGALHALYDVEEGTLPPLTIVLFRQSRDFAPYRIVTQSGQAQVAGFFGRTENWSVIGLSGGGRDANTRAVIQHEAVHWFASATTMPPPLWFSEGIAEVLSSFRVVNGKGRWGEAIDYNVGYLQYAGLLPIEDLLRASQDEALHGRESSRFYPQAWAFVHYLMFGNGGAQSAKLYEFLRLRRQTDLDTAFATAFGKSYDEFTGELRQYVRNGRYSYAQVPLRDRSGEMIAAPASELNVAAGLGLLAAIGGNHQLALKHIERVIALAPNSPAGYDLAALAAENRGDLTALDAAVDHAIALGSRDASVYRTKADRLIAANRSTDGLLAEPPPPDVARAAADLYRRALELRPRDPGALRGLPMALLSVTAPTDADRSALSSARIVSPTNGLLLVGQAAIEKSRDNLREAADLLREALGDPYTLPRGFRAYVTALRNSWLGAWLATEYGSLSQASRFGEARAFLAAHLADETITGSLRTMLENRQKELPDLERLHAAVQANLAGRPQEAIALLTAIVDDPDVQDRTRRTAERMLQNRRVMAMAPMLDD